MDDLSREDLAFLERARQGQLSGLPELSTYHIALLRFPADRNARHRWRERLATAIVEGNLPRPYRSTTIHQGNLTITAYHIRADAYLEYAILQRLFGRPIPADSLERCWIPGLEVETTAASQSDAALAAQRREPVQIATTAPPADNRRSEEQRNIANLQHADRNAWYASKVREARDEWKKGSTLRHDQMAGNLMEDAPKGISKTTLRGKLTDLLRDELKRPDLIRGYKK